MGYDRMSDRIESAPYMIEHNTDEVDTVLE